MEKKILETDLALELIASLVKKTLKKYKIDHGTAVQIVSETMGAQPKLLQLLENGDSLKKIMQSRVYDEVSTEARRKIYYKLRQYKQNAETQESLIHALKQVPPGALEIEYRGILEKLLQSHISTRERYEVRETFYVELFNYIGQPASIIDIGCGMQPLLFPFRSEGKNVSCYLALDKDKLTISAVEAFAKILGGNILHAVNWDLKDGWEKVKKDSGRDYFDVAFLMKLVPAVYRLERRLIEILLKVPAQMWVITGSRNSMTRYINIEKRERRFINEFIQRSGKNIKGEFTLSEEFCVIVS